MSELYQNEATSLRVQLAECKAEIERAWAACELARSNHKDAQDRIDRDIERINALTAQNAQLAAERDAAVARVGELEEERDSLLCNLDNDSITTSLLRKEYDKLAARLQEAERDVQSLATENLTLNAEAMGPDGFETWNAAAVHERLLRKKAERALARIAAMNHTSYCDPHEGPSDMPEHAYEECVCPKGIARAALASLRDGGGVQKEEVKGDG